MCSETASQLPEENPAQPVREIELGAMNAIPQGYSDLLQDVKRRADPVHHGLHWPPGVACSRKPSRNNLG